MKSIHAGQLLAIIFATLLLSGFARAQDSYTVTERGAN
jgi:hypothetical protein